VRDTGCGEGYGDTAIRRYGDTAIRDTGYGIRDTGYGIRRYGDTGYGEAAAVRR